MHRDDLGCLAASTLKMATEQVSETLVCNRHLTQLLAQEISSAHLTFLVVIISGSRNEKVLTKHNFGPFTAVATQGGNDSRKLPTTLHL
jgi:hypothetical protein